MPVCQDKCPKCGAILRERAFLSLPAEVAERIDRAAKVLGVSRQDFASEMIEQLLDEAGAPRLAS